MRAVVLHEYGGPEKLKFEDNVPEPQISGSTVLIAAAAASVNPIDWKLRSGMRQKDSPLSFPAILGRDVSGIVRAVGANVKHFKAGDRVLALSNATYAELVAVNDSDLAHLPDGVDLANAAAIPLISLTGDQLVRLAANVQKGQFVLITGALGSVGRAAVHTAKKIGAQVIAGVRGKEMDDARSLGVSDVLAIDDDNAIENFHLAQKLGRDTTFGRIIEAVERAEKSRAPIQKTADRLAGYLVFFALGAAVLTFIITHNVRSTISVVIVAGACGIAAGTPLAILGAIGRAAHQGAIIKGGLYLEALATVDTVLLDKTSTLTFGTPQIREVVSANGFGEKQIIAAASIAERKSEHPLAKAVVARAMEP